MAAGRRAALRPTWALAGERPAVVVVAALGVALVAVLLALYPSLVLLLAALAAILVLARSNPSVAFLLALGLFAVEGTIKVRLTVENVPHPLSVGAAAIDAGLAIGLVGMALRAGTAPPREIWRQAGRAERVGLALVAAWLVLSVIQVPLGGHPLTGLKGFRLTQAYVAAGLLGGVLLGSLGAWERLTRAALVAIGLVAAYAAVRVVIGASGSEEAFAVAPGVPQEFGSAFRAVGSFSGAFGLASFLVPGTVLAFAIALTTPRERWLAVAVCALGLTALVGSLVRAALVALAVGLFVVTALLVFDRRLGRRPKLLIAGSLLLVVVAAVGAVTVSSGLSGQVRERAKGFVSPGSDRSAQIRANTWRRTLREVRKQPLGAGLGRVGRATGGAGGTGANAAGAALHGSQKATYTDNSFLKLLREQGVEGLLLFLGGMLALLGTLVAKLIRAGPTEHPVALGATSAVCAFLVLFMFAEYIEQPGKVLVWTLLGLAIWDLRRSGPAGRPEPYRAPAARPPALWWAGTDAARAGCVAIVAVLAVVPTCLATARQASYATRVEMQRSRPTDNRRFEALFPTPSSGTYVGGLLRTRDTRIGIAAGVTFLVSSDQLRDRFGVVERPGLRATVTARADTPERARDLARVTGDQLGAASSREVDRSATNTLGAVADLPFIRRTIAQPPARILPATDPRTPPVGGLASAVQRLPGPFPPRPSPLFVLMAGLALGAALGWGFLTLSARRDPSGRTPSP